MNDTCRQVEERLQAYVDGDLPSREATSVYLHLQECPACAAAERELRALVALLDSLPRPEPPPDFDARVLAAVPLDRYREMAHLRRPRVAVWLEPETLPAWVRSRKVRLAGVLAAAAGAALAVTTNTGAAWWAVAGVVPELLMRLQALGRRLWAGEPHHDTHS